MQMIRFGGDYNPEQWPEDTWRDDVRLMKEAGVNLVTVGVFSWARLQPAEGEFDFGWLDRVLELMDDGGVEVDLATATASPPPWLVHAYPDVLPVTRTGLRLGPGSRQHYSPTSPDYRRLAADLVHRMGERYRGHPAVAMWHVNNEYACHVHADYSDNAAVAFRVWLERRYRSIAALNEAWSTAFWSQRYSGFAEIEPPRASPSTQNPTSVLDFRRFTSESVLELYRMERDELRRVGAVQPVTTNFMGAFEPMDYWAWAQEVDFVSNDSYPDPRDPHAYQESAFVGDLMRSLKPGEPWLVMEQSPGSVQWRPNNAPKMPGQMAAWSEQALARGSSGVMFFQWRQSRGGSEKFHSGMVPQSGERSRTWHEVVALGASLAGREPANPPRGPVAIVLDWENWWALDQPDLPADIDYRSEVFQWYRAVNSRNVQTSFVRAEDDLSEFRIVIAPALYMLTTAGAECLRSFVEGGGILLTTPFTDLVDEHDRFRDGGYSVQLSTVLGGAPVDFSGVLTEDGRRGSVAGRAAFCIRTLAEDFVVDEGDPILRRDDEVPLLVHKRSGRGASYHLTAFLDDDGAQWVLGLVLDAAGVEPVLHGLDPGVEAIDTGADVVVINQTDHPTAVIAHDHVVTPLAPFEVRRLPHPRQ